MKQILVTGGAGFIGSNLTLELQNQYPKACITVLDDFRCSDFKNLEGFKGDIVAADMSRLDFKAQFGSPAWDAVFHLASITDTTNHKQFEQVHDNVEGFRRLLEFLKPAQTPVIYASSAATYGITSGVNRETDPLRPANVYAFTKVALENLVNSYLKEMQHWKLIGLRYFNVYGPREAHKGVPASMIYHLAQQMKKGQRPKLFKWGEQMRDFVYVKDVVACTIAALNAKKYIIFNVGSGNPRPFKDIPTILNQLMKLNVEVEYIDNPYSSYQPHTEADMSRALEDLNFKPKFSLEQGIEDYYNSGLLISA